MIPGETIATGASEICGEQWEDLDSEPCKHIFKLEVLQSPAGYYLGTQCPTHGPNSRETGYYKTREKAEQALKSGDINWR